MAKRKSPQARGEKFKPESEMTLDWLIENITPANRHEAFDWGPPVGKEIW